MSEAKSTRVPPTLQKLLKYDAYITNEVISWANKHLALDGIRIHCKVLEISCHGILWFTFWIGFIWIFNNPSLVQLQVNMLLGLFTDIIFVAVAKAYFRRKRPSLTTVGKEVFSFPSGHASRSVFAAYFFARLWPLHFSLVPLILIWSVGVCVSRILMNTHYIMDVIGGCVLGIVNGLLIGLLWVDDSTARWLIKMISDDEMY